MVTYKAQQALSIGTEWLFPSSNTPEKFESSRQQIMIAEPI